MQFKKKLKGWLKDSLSSSQIEKLKQSRCVISRIIAVCMYPYARFIKTPINKIRNSKKSERLLEIGPGPERIKGFETINVVWGKHVDYIADASKSLPFNTGTFDLIYASHVLEHIPWYQVENVMKEWVRLLKPNGKIEVWIPNGLLIAKTFVDVEEGIENQIYKDGWYRFNPDKDPCVWANGRIFSYGDGNGKKNHQNWHLTMFSPRYLEKVMGKAGLSKLERLSNNEVRGHDHGWINLGMRGYKL